MVMELKKDRRDKLWSELESKIQKRANKKDGSFILSGKWKKFVRKQDRFKIYSVDGEWVRNNLSVIFGHGGHGYVHEFIPKNEIWISTNHFEGCGCDNLKKKNQKVSKNYFDSTTAHEIEEFKKMKKGKVFWEAHHRALKKEMELSLLKDPHTEVD